MIIYVMDILLATQKKSTTYQDDNKLKKTDKTMFLPYIEQQCKN